VIIITVLPSSLWICHHRVLQVRAGQRVERAEGLVEQQHLRLHGERAGDADALLHAAGDFRGTLVLGVAHLHEVEIVHRPVVALGARLRPRTPCRPRADVVVDGQPRQQRVVLEHDRAVGSRARSPRGPPGGRRRRSPGQAGDDVEQRRLAAAGMADDRDVLALVDAEVMSLSTSVSCVPRLKVLST
jgi:hypothetical protein